jgi:hypothetical protein
VRGAFRSRTGPSRTGASPGCPSTSRLPGRRLSRRPTTVASPAPTMPTSTGMSTPAAIAAKSASCSTNCRHQLYPAPGNGAVASARWNSVHRRHHGRPNVSTFTPAATNRPGTPNRPRAKSSPIPSVSAPPHRPARRPVVKPEPAPASVSVPVESASRRDRRGTSRTRAPPWCPRLRRPAAGLGAVRPGHR